ncbi:MAG TPA: Smr/MutS family protein [Gammaproteobacteria bacterium]|nr:Smr/MutS family protein [Gammaproteobacteria bacterium]
MPKKPRITQEERDLFRASVPKVAPLKQHQQYVSGPSSAKKLKISTFVPRAEQEPEIIPLREDPSLEPVNSEDFLSFSQTGLQYRTLQRLRRGEMVIDAEIDLHGLTVVQAEAVLGQFLAEALKRGWRCVCIIHGKAARKEDNRPILKNKVNQWLRLYPGVLAFCSAKPGHGGVGAVYVLLKRL